MPSKAKSKRAKSVSTSSYNRNPSGNNGLPHIPPADDPVLKAALEEYHRAGKTNNSQISLLLHSDHNILCRSAEFYLLYKSTSNSTPIPHLYFLATPLLPCGPLHPNIKKFTGNGYIGPAQDALTKAIHAFVHFSVIYTHETLLICDLQGAPDTKGRMCLIDPQAHNANRDPDVYWDKGPAEIQRFHDQHNPEECEKNWVCRALKLKS